MFPLNKALPHPNLLDNTNQPDKQFESSLPLDNNILLNMKYIRSFRLTVDKCLPDKESQIPNLLDNKILPDKSFELLLLPDNNNQLNTLYILNCLVPIDMYRQNTFFYPRRNKNIQSGKYDMFHYPNNGSHM